MDTYTVIFTGRIAEKMTRQQVEEKLLKLLGCSAETIKPLFRGKPLILKKNLPRNKAEAYAKAFSQAGALCDIQKSEQVQKQDTTPEESKTGKRAVRVVSPVIGQSQIAFTPLPSPFFSSAEGGININRRDKVFIPFEHISLVAVAYDSGRDGPVLRLLVFIRSEKRPVIVDAEKINFATFPNVSDKNMLLSLRRFLKFLLTKNPGILIDEETYAFLQGGRPRDLLRDIDALATALACSASTKNGNGKAVDLQPPPSEDRPSTTTEVFRDSSTARPASETVVPAPSAVLPPEHVEEPNTETPMLEKGTMRRRAVVYFCLSLFFCLGVISLLTKPDRGGGAYNANLTPPYSGRVFRESPAMKKQRELLEFNRKGAQTTKVVGIIISALLAVFFFQKAFGYWTLYQEKRKLE